MGRAERGVSQARSAVGCVDGTGGVSYWVTLFRRCCRCFVGFLVGAMWHFSSVGWLMFEQPVNYALFFFSSCCTHDRSSYQL